ncbi:hypothetical protein O181_035953 [Austropuccinia psidii MF-1]|uniref:Sfi1 spindle body domain-containing protein n=1 Tax=Austropuccinia psidii MF-1 TaxID=1389203 RepID=A0A9Q3H8R1_9BASI|nr:hypothetical protein [Austropuccinia psidii MF-1]
MLSAHEVSALKLREGPSFPSLPPFELDIMAKIMRQTPPNTTTFNALWAPYQEVLSQNNIEHKTDEKFYSLLLKLSMVPGIDWQQKWQRALVQQASRDKLGPSTKVNPDSATTPASFSKPPPPAQAQTRLRSLPSQPLPVKQASNCPPRVIKSVHFLPSNHHGSLQPNPVTLPSYPVSSITAKKAPLTQLVDYSDIKARNLRRRHLLNRFFICWKNYIVRWNTLALEADRARGILDVSAKYQTWKLKARAEIMRCNLADHARNTRISLLHLNHWRRLTIEKRERKWLLCLVKTCRDIRRAKDRKLRRQVLIMWANHLKSSRLFMTRQSRFVYKLMSNWYLAYQRTKELHFQSTTFRLESNIRNLRKSFIQWTQKASMQSNLKKFLLARNTRLKTYIFFIWRGICIQSHSSRVFFLRIQLRTFLRAWRRLYAHQKVLKTMVARAIFHKDQNMKLQILRRWIAEKLSEAVEASIAKGYLSSSPTDLLNCFNAHSSTHQSIVVLQVWKQRYDANVLHKSLSDELYRFFLIRDSFLAWIIHCNHCKHTEIQADLIRNKLLARRAWRIWRQKIHKKRITCWLRVRNTNRLRTLLSFWVATLQKKKRVSGCLLLFHQRSAIHMRTRLFSRWRDHSALRKQQDDQGLHFHEKKLIQKLWKTWKNYTKHLNDLEHTSDLIAVQRNETHKADLMFHWLWRTRENISRNSRLSAVLDKKRSHILLLTWALWRDNTRWRQLYPKASYFVDEKHESCKAWAFQLWMLRSSLLLAIRTSKRRSWIQYIHIWQKYIRIKTKLAVADEIFYRRLYKTYFDRWIRRHIDIKTSKMISRFKKHKTLFYAPGTRSWRQQTSNQLESDITFDSC